MFRKGIAALAGVGAVAAVGQHLASAPSRVHPLLQAYHRSAAAATSSSTQPQHRRSHTSVSVANLGKEGAAAAAVLENPEWPEEWPFTEEDFKRYDVTSDLDFYAAPRIVHHIENVNRAGVAMSKACHVGEAQRLYLEDDEASTTQEATSSSSVTMALAALLPITAVLSFVGGTRLAKSGTQPARDCESLMEDSQVE